MTIVACFIMVTKTYFLISNDSVQSKSLEWFPLFLPISFASFMIGDPEKEYVVNNAKVVRSDWESATFFQASSLKLVDCASCDCTAQLRGALFANISRLLQGL